MSTVAAQRSLPRRVLDTFVSPGDLFASFRDQAPWAGPLLLSVVLSVAVAALIPAELMQEQMAEAIRERGGTVPPNLDTMTGFTRIIAILGPAISLPLLALLIAGLLTLVFSAILGGEGSFRQHLAVTTHAQLIMTLGTLVTFPLMILRGDLRTQLSLSLLAPFLEAGSAPYLILQGLNVFTLWTLVVIGLGVSIVDRRQSWLSAAGILLGIYLVLDVAVSLLMA